MKPGHDSGQVDPSVDSSSRWDVPGPADWGKYVAHFKEEAGSWSALADALIQRTAGIVDAPSDPGSVERGLRRLAGREHKPGGSYGRWMLRFFGMPADAEAWARMLAQYHRRFADLPTSLRLEQLRLWDRPPVSESRLSAWIDVGIASVLHRREDLAECRHRLDRACARAEKAGPAAQMEVKLFDAYFFTGDDNRAKADALFDEVEALLDAPKVGEHDRRCYHARLIGQRAYHLTKPLPGESADHEAALHLFESIEETLEIPFVCFRKFAGLAYCTWQLGDAAEGARLARVAAQHAGDGGLVRFRVMALNMLSRMVDRSEAEAISQRAARLARLLEDEDLSRRVHRRAPR